MAYKNKTVSEVYNLLKESFLEQFGNKVRFLPKCFINILCKILSVLFVIPYKLVGWFWLQLFPDTAAFKYVNVMGYEFNPLIMLGNQFGVKEPMSGQTWEGVIRAKVINENYAVNMGAQLKSDKTGLLYVTKETVTTEGESVLIPVYCNESGVNGNLDVGDELKFVSPLSSVEQVATIEEITKTGTDDETEEHYRNRVKTRYSTQPQGGASADYRLWAYDVPGVLQVYPYNNDNYPGGVIIYVAGTTDVYPTRVPGRELCIAVGEACTYNPETGIASRKPLTAVLDPEADRTYRFVQPVSIVYVNVFITDISGVDVSDFATTFKTALNNYLMECEPYIRGLSDDNNKKNLIDVNTLIATANSVATSHKAQFGTVQMTVNNTVLSSYELKKNELAALGTLYIDGELYEE